MSTLSSGTNVGTSDGTSEGTIGGTVGGTAGGTTGQTATGDRATGAPFKIMAALTAAVLLAHGFILQSTSVALRASERPVTRPFTTRMIEIKPAAQPGGEVTAAPALTAVAAPAAARGARPRKPGTRPNAAVSPKPDLAADVEQNQAIALAPYVESAINSEANDSATSAATVGPAPAPAPVTAASSPQPPTPGVAAFPGAALSSPSTSPPLPATSQALARAYTVPGSVRLKYNVAGTKDQLNYSARAELQWLQDGSTYEARLEVGAFLLGSRTFTSTGRMTSDGLAPLRYSDKTRSELAAHFDYDKQRVTFSANTPEAALQSGAQDRVSVFVQLGSMLAAAPDKYPAGTSLSVQIIGPRATEIWVVTVDGDEKLNLPGGELTAVKFTRGVRSEFDLKTEFWLAPALGFLPARIRFTQVNGDLLDLVWRATETP